MEPLSVSAVEFGRDIDRHQDIALHRPVAVTRDGQARTVLISVKEYRRLTFRREVLSLDDFTEEDVHALEESRPPRSAAAFDDEIAS